MSYKSLKNGWVTLVDFSEEYNLNVYRRNILIAKLDDLYKEKIGKTWVVLKKEATKKI